MRPPRDGAKRPQCGVARTESQLEPVWNLAADTLELAGHCGWILFLRTKGYRDVRTQKSGMIRDLKTRRVGRRDPGSVSSRCSPTDRLLHDFTRIAPVSGTSSKYILYVRR